MKILRTFIFKKNILKEEFCKKKTKLKIFLFNKFFKKIFFLFFFLRFTKLFVKNKYPRNRQ